MKINQTKNTQNFKGLYNNKLLLSGLKKISNHGASFAAGVSFIGAIGLRPLAINLTPKTKKENKKILSAESVSSGLIKLSTALAISLPIESAVKKIDENKDKFLNKETLDNLSQKDYKFLTQTIKLSSNLISAIPKSLLAVAMIPLIDKILHPKKKEKEYSVLQNESFDKFKNQLSFKGNKSTEIISSLINSKKMQEFAINHSKNDKNIAKNMSVLTDTLLTTTSVFATKQSKKIKKEDKKPLMINKILSSAISILLGCSIDKYIQKLGQNSIEKFKQVNINDKNLPKYLEGINIIRPTIIFALLYYGIIPITTTFLTNVLSDVKKD